MNLESMSREADSAGEALKSASISLVLARKEQEKPLRWYMLSEKLFLYSVHSTN
jgi:hypothetical protein